MTTLNNDERELEFLARTLRPEVVFQILKDDLGERVVECLGEFVGHRPNINHYFLAKALDEGNWVFTTNQDNLIEQACDEMGIDIRNRLCISDNEYDQFKKIAESITNTNDIPGGFLFKIHGSIDEEKHDLEMYRTILMTLREVGRSFNETKRFVLEYFLKRVNFCFIGYSCRDDFSIYPILRDTQSNKIIVWFDYTDQPIMEIMCSKAKFQEEIDVEDQKPTWDKNWSIININTVLLMRGAAIKLRGDSSNFINGVMSQIIDKTLFDKLVYNGSSTRVPKYQGLSKWAECIGPYNRLIASGRLWEACWDGDRAVKYFELAKTEAENSNQIFEKAKAIKLIAEVCDTQLGESKNALEYYETSFNMLKDFGSADSIYDASFVNIERANLLRREFKYFSRAKEYLQESIKLITPSKDNGSEIHRLAYARSLNILGLVYYQSGEDLMVAKELCEESVKIKKEYGDINGIAESKNALGLIFDKMGKCEESIGYYNDAIKCRERIGNYRGLGQQYRNLGLCYEKLGNYEQGKESYEKGKINWYRIKNGTPPVRELLELLFLLGRIYIRMGHEGDAVKELENAAQKWQNIGEWHNRARCLDLLRDCYTNLSAERLKDTCLEIISIYMNVLNDENKLEELHQAKIKYENAKEFLQKTRLSIEKAFSSEDAREHTQEISIILDTLARRFE